MTPIVNKQIKHAITIKAREVVGLMNNSKFQLDASESYAKIIN